MLQQEKAEREAWMKAIAEQVGRGAAFLPLSRFVSPFFLWGEWLSCSATRMLLNHPFNKLPLQWSLRWWQGEHLQLLADQQRQIVAELRRLSAYHCEH